MYKRIIQVWSELTHKTLLRRQTKYVTNSYGTIDLYIDKSQIRLVGDWHEQGLNRTENILTPDGAFVLYNDLTQKHIIDYWSYISLLDAIPKDWKNILISTRMPEQITIAEQAKNRNITIGQSSVLIEKAVHRDIYNYNLFRNEIAHTPTVEKKIKECFSADIDTTLIYSLP